MKNRTERFCIRLTKEEKELVTILAKKRGLNYTDLVVALTKENIENKENGGNN